MTQWQIDCVVLLATLVYYGSSALTWRNEMTYCKRCGEELEPAIDSLDKEPELCATCQDEVSPKLEDDNDSAICPDCNGSGEGDTDELCCWNCKGKGTVTDQ